MPDFKGQIPEPNPHPSERGPEGLASEPDYVRPFIAASEQDIGSGDSVVHKYGSDGASLEGQYKRVETDGIGRVYSAYEGNPYLADDGRIVARGVPGFPTRQGQGEKTPATSETPSANPTESDSQKERWTSRFWRATRKLLHFADLRTSAPYEVQLPIPYTGTGEPPLERITEVSPVIPEDRPAAPDPDRFKKLNDWQFNVRAAKQAADIQERAKREVAEKKPFESDMARAGRKKREQQEAIARTGKLPQRKPRS